MKNIFIILTLTFSISIARAQKSKLGWFISPEIGGIFHGDHIGNTVGASLGIKLFNDHLKIGIQGYGRSGPINAKEYVVEASGGQSYKGSTQLKLRADHGVVGLFIAPSFNIHKLHVDLPIAIGQFGAGYYFTGEDRDTPDGRRVSEWENELMDERDAAVGGWIEFGSRIFFPLKHENLSLGVGLHYTLAPGWETYVDPEGDMYNNRLRFSLILNFESKK